MDLPDTAALAPRLITPDETESTNADLIALAAADPALPAGTVLVTDRQTAGRGRLGRSWWAPPGTSLAISVLLRPRLPAEQLGWVPLVAGAAMAISLRAHGVDAALKWPNDVQVGGKKVCGVLAEALADGGGVVVGAGLNHRVPADAMPVPTATSLLVEGGPTDPDLLISGWLREIDALLAALESDGPDALRDTVAALTSTIGRRVRVEPPSGEAFEGTAVGLDVTGALIVDDGSGAPHLFGAGDVTHLRVE